MSKSYIKLNLCNTDRIFFQVIAQEWTQPPTTDTSNSSNLFVSPSAIREESEQDLNQNDGGDCGANKSEGSMLPTGLNLAKMGLKKQHSEGSIKEAGASNTTSPTGSNSQVSA